MTNETSHAAELGIDPEDMGLAKEIMDFDPVYDVKGPTEVIGNVTLPTEVNLSALSPEKQDAIRKELSDTPAHMQESVERRLIHEALYQNSFMLRVKGGGGGATTPLQAESLEIASNRAEAQDEAMKIAAQLAEVSYWKPGTDPSTGEQAQIAVNVIEGDRRIALENEMNRLFHKVEELDNGEGPRRLKAALSESITKQKSLDKQVRVMHKADKLADELDEQELIERRAAALRSARRDRPA